MIIAEHWWLSLRGLYQKALEIYRQSSHPSEESYGITPEEKERFQEQIDELLSRNRLAVTPEALTMSPRGVISCICTNVPLG